MTVRYCPTCDTDVEDVGGFCLVGHRLTERPLRAATPSSVPAPAPPSLADLRAEVDRAFEEARIQVAAALAPLNGMEPPSAGPIAPPPPPAIEELDEISVPHRSYDGLFETMESAEPGGVDPINAFAPPPRMDWGPERSSKKRGGIIKRTHPENA